MLELPLFLSLVACGFPLPAQDYTEQTIDLNQLCVAHSAIWRYSLRYPPWWDLSFSSRSGE